MKGTQGLRDEIKQERLKLLEGKSTGYKIKYYVYYYKWYAAGVIALIVLTASVIHSIRTNKDPALGIAVVNGAYEADYEGMERRIEEYIGVDDKHEVQIDSDFFISTDGQGAYDLQAEEKLFMTMATGQIDVLIAPESIFKKFADVGYVTDLGNVLTEDEIKKLNDIFIGHVADDSVAAVDDENTPRHEERSGINISEFTMFTEEGWYPDAKEPVYLGFVMDGNNDENAVKFYEFLRE